MPRSPRTVLAAILSGCLLAAFASTAAAQEMLLTKSESLTDKDDKDTKLKNSYRKVYTIKLAEGKAYRIDLNSKDFDTFLRLEDAKGKEVAFNDDVAPPGNLNSRIVYAAAKSGEFRIIVTTFEAGKTGEFKLDVMPATDAEAAEARVQARIDAFGDASPAEQKKLIEEVNKDFAKRSPDLTIKDANIAATLAMNVDETNIEFARETIKGFVKTFEGASNKQLAGFTRFLEGELKKLDKIGTEFEIAGKTTDGGEFNLKNLKGKVVLVDFWATWCGPCVAEVPNIISAHTKYAKKGFEVIGVSLDRDNAHITKFVEAKNLPWKSINIEDSKPLAEKYGVNAIPYPVLVGRDGRVVSLRARGPQLERLLARLIDEKK